MSEWVNADIAKPPESHSVLLYIVIFHEDGKSIWDDTIVTGFYGSTNESYDKNGFYIEIIEDLKIEYVFLEEQKQLKVIAWTLLPRRPYKTIFDGDWKG